MKRSLLILTTIFVLTSCEKKAAIKVDSNFVGEWYHYESSEAYHHITIYFDGTGYNYGSEDWEETTGDQQRKWFVRGQILEFGNGAPEFEKFQIDSFPQVSISLDTIGLNYIDSTDKYMWLENRVYVSSN